MSQPTVEFTGGLYWRKSWWNGRACVPVILRVSGGQLRMRDETGVIFQAPCAGVQAKLSSMKTLTLRINGKKYYLVGRGGQISKTFTPDMQQELHQALQQGPGTPGAATFSHLGLAAADVSSLRNTEPWKAVLQAAGARVS